MSRTPSPAFSAPWTDRPPVRALCGLLGWLWLLIQRMRTPGQEARPGRAFGDTFLQGVNLPWFSCGNDFGCNAWHPEGGISAPGRIQRIRPFFEALQRDGITCLRWWLFADGRSGIRCDPTGSPKGLDDRVFPDIDLALELAAAHGIRIIPVCFDFLLCGPEQRSGGVQSGGRRGWIRDPEQWVALEVGVLKPLFARYGSHPAILAWDLFNEPEWAVLGAGCRDASLPPWLLRSRLERMVRLAHRCGDRPVTVGLASTRGLSLVRGIGLDFFQVHWYDPQDASSPLDRPVARLGLDRPLLLGEFPTRNSRRSLAEIVELAQRHGYCGALGWSLLAQDACSGLELSALPAEEATEHAPDALPTHMPWEMDPTCLPGPSRPCGCPWTAGA